MKQLSDSLLGAESIAAQPDQAATVMASFAEADRNGMFHAMRSMMLHRSGIEDLLSRIAVPTLVMPVRDDAMGWRPDEAAEPVPPSRTAASRKSLAGDTSHRCSSTATESCGR